jgi:hypothetical protein
MWKTLNVLCNGGEKMNQWLVFLICQILGIVEYYIEIGIFFPLVEILTKYLRRCHLQSDSLEKLIFVNKKFIEFELWVSCTSPSSFVELSEKMQNFKKSLKSLKVNGIKLLTFDKLIYFISFYNHLSLIKLLDFEIREWGPPWISYSYNQSTWKECDMHPTLVFSFNGVTSFLCVFFSFPPNNCPKPIALRKPFFLGS